MKVICIRQNPSREPQPQLGQVYDAEIIEVETKDKKYYPDYMYHIKEVNMTYSNYWVIPLRDYNIDKLCV
jgi:hypothetical protein